jgi:hypothetical protein
MSFSLTDLATRVLKDLGLIAAEEVPSANDLSWAQETVSSEVALLGAIDMPIWNGSDLSVPIEYLTPLSLRIGARIAPSFGLMTPAQAVQAMQATEQDLRKLSMRPGTGVPQQNEHF